jgi:hypothetical protein
MKDPRAMFDRRAYTLYRLVLERRAVVASSSARGNP